MKITNVALIAVAGMLAASAVPAEEQEQERAALKPQTVCPVMGGKINRTQFADVKGKRIYVCCPGCIRAIESQPDKYIEKLESRGVTMDPVPATARTPGGAGK
jgi:YHS domain-containing protein